MDQSEKRATLLLREIVSRMEWNGFRQAWEVKPDLPAGTVTAARDVVARIGRVAS